MKENPLTPETVVIDPKLLTLPIKRIDGTLTGETMSLPAEVFGVIPKSHVIYLVIKAELANLRQGTHSTRTRGEVSGGGR
ncbi:MAG: 50S ribosomal protein L4, partial [bacterium]